MDHKIFQVIALKGMAKLFAKWIITWSTENTRQSNISTALETDKFNSYIMPKIGRVGIAAFQKPMFLYYLYPFIQYLLPSNPTLEVLLKL